MNEMSYMSKQDVVRVYRKRYVLADRVGKGLILDQLCGLTGYDRKHAIKLMNRKAGNRGRPAGRKKRYGPDVTEVLHAIWMAGEQLCGKRLKEALPLWLPHYEQAHGRFTPDLRERVLTISAAQIDRLLRPFRVEAGAWRRTGPKPGTLIKKQVPIRCNGWRESENEPGYLEVDTVAHCGGSMSGSFVWSVTLTDIATNWTSVRATWNRGQHGVLEQIKDVEANLPFPLRGFDCDNGGEFLNDHLLTYLRARERPVSMTRSRPYHKNDNAHVEQKNWTHVRQLLAYHRIGNPRQVDVINRLYREAWEPLHNFFLPSVKLVEKRKTEDGRWHKVYDTPRTPCDRLLDRPDLPAETRACLLDQRARLNPFVLKLQIETLLAEVWAVGKTKPVDLVQEAVVEGRKVGT